MRNAIISKKLIVNFCLYVLFISFGLTFGRRKSRSAFSKPNGLLLQLQEGRSHGTLNSVASRRIERLAFLWKPALWRLKFPFPWYSYRRPMLRISPWDACAVRERERERDSEEIGERGARDTNRTGGPCHTLVLIRDEDTINEERREKSETSSRLSPIANRNCLVDHAVPEISRFIVRGIACDSLHTRDY